MSTDRDRSPLSSNVFVQLAAAFLQDWHALASILIRLASLLSLDQNRGMYETLDYDFTLELLDAEGHTAIFRKRQKVRFLQDNIIAFQDYAWGAPRGAV